MSFKFFRSWNKKVIFIAMAALMVVFLIEGAMMHRNPSGNDLSGEPIGTLAGAKLTIGQQREAARDVHIVGSLTPYLVAFAGARDRDSDTALLWLLMLQDAKRIGISASDSEANTLLNSIGLGDDDQLANIASRLQATPEQVREAYRNWAIVQQYRELSLGVTHTSVSDWGAIVMTVSQYSREFQRENADAMTRMIIMNQLSQMLESAQGHQRLSAALVARVVQDQQANAKVAAVVLAGDKYAPKAEPTAAEIQELFDKHKDRLPDETPKPGQEGDAFNFGYRFPDRVKIEYLAVPGDELRKKVEIDETDAIAYYEQNQTRFTERPAAAETRPADAKPVVKPYEAVRGEIVSALREQKARELGDRVIRDAETVLSADIRKLPEQGGYRQIPDNYKPIPLEAAVQEIGKKHGIKASAVRLDEQWTPAADLTKLAGLGDVTLDHAGRRFVTITDYVLSAKEFSPKSENTLVTLRLQAMAPSVALSSPMDGGRYIFRIVAADPAHTPASLDEVRDQVTRDARRLASYNKLLADREKLAQRFASVGPKAFAEEVKASVVEPPPFSRRRMDRSGMAAVPAVKDIGISRAFVDGVFQLAEKLGGPAEIAAAPAAKRSDAVAMPDKLSLVFYRLDEFTPMTRKEFDYAASNPEMARWAVQAMTAPKSGEADPLSLDALSKRLNFVRSGDKS